MADKEHTAKWSDNLTEQPQHKGKIPLTATSFTTKPTESGLDICPSLLGVKPYNNNLGCGRAFLCGYEQNVTFLCGVTAQVGPRSCGIVEVSRSH